MPSEFNPNFPGNLVVVAYENVPANTLVLRRPDRTPCFHLKVATEYTVVQHLEASARLRYEAIVTMYLSQSMIWMVESCLRFTGIPWG